MQKKPIISANMTPDVLLTEVQTGWILFFYSKFHFFLKSVLFQKTKKALKIKTKNEIPLEIFTIKVQISRGIHMVEMMGVEPMSENPLTKPSSWTVCYL